MTADDIIADIIRREGVVFTDIPGDVGGPTKFGITLKTLQQVQPDATVEVLRDLTIDTAHDVYSALYVRPFVPYANGDDALLALMVDSAVQHGVSRLQRWICVEGYRTFPRLLAHRIQFYGQICVADPSQLKFLNGWLNRATSFIR